MYQMKKLKREQNDAFIEKNFTLNTKKYFFESFILYDIFISKFMDHVYDCCCVIISGHSE